MNPGGMGMPPYDIRAHGGHERNERPKP